jgi:hypothetical protein
MQPEELVEVVRVDAIVTWWWSGVTTVPLSGLEVVVACRAVRWAMVGSGKPLKRFGRSVGRITALKRGVNEMCRELGSSDFIGCVV